MVATEIITGANARFAAEHHEGFVSVFMGATSGIGAATLERMLGMFESSTFYVLGRNPSRYADHLDALRKQAPSNKIVFLEAQVSLIADVDAACARITAAEGKVDFVCLSPGGMPFRGEVLTKEGLEQSFSVSYYSRLRLVSNLLPLLHKSQHPHVLSILNGTKEKQIAEDDIGLQTKWSIVRLVDHSTLLTSLSFDHLVATDAQKHLTFIHTTPGFVNTGTLRTDEHRPRMADGFFRWALVTFFQIVSGWIIKFTGMAVKESGERHAYLLTSDALAPGSWRVDSQTEVIPDNPVLREYQERGWAEKAWDHTLQTWARALSKGSQA